MSETRKSFSKKEHRCVPLFESTEKCVDFGLLFVKGRKQEVEPKKPKRVPEVAFIYAELKVNLS